MQKLGVESINNEQIEWTYFSSSDVVRNSNFPLLLRWSKEVLRAVVMAVRSKQEELRQTTIRLSALLVLLFECRRMMSEETFRLLFPPKQQERRRWRQLCCCVGDETWLSASVDQHESVGRKDVGLGGAKRSVTLLRFVFFFWAVVCLSPIEASGPAMVVGSSTLQFPTEEEIRRNLET